MTKLDEIEAKADKAVGRMDDEIAFLIRAVRQLGAIVRERESEAITRNRLEEHGIYDNLIDPDVLELIEE